MRRSVGPRLVLGGVLAAIALACGVLLAAATLSPGAASGPDASPPTATPFDEKGAAAVRNTPPPARPTTKAWIARTPADVLANLPQDPNFARAMANLTGGVEPDPRARGKTPTLDAPIFVRGLRPGEPNEYLVPVTVERTTIAVLRVGLDANFFGQLQSSRGWSAAPTFPARDHGAARIAAASPTDAAVSAELVWTQIRGLSDELAPFWRVTRASGAVIYVFESGEVVAASVFGLE